jgi:hypothetical protein
MRMENRRLPAMFTSRRDDPVVDDEADDDSEEGTSSLSANARPENADASIAVRIKSLGR